NENLWTDNQVNNATATRPKNKNLVGDGKFDQPDFPSALELSVGRIDFFKMTKFLKTETDLLKAYFQRNHLFRTGALQIPQRGLIDDNFGPFSNGMQGGGRYVESFATTAWRSWTPLISYSKIVETDYVNTLDTASFLWSYGCGSGGYQSAGGIGTTEVFVQNSINTIFTSLFGSYFGDWDSDNNFLRAPLCATPGALTSVWAGRPHWFFHRMGLGEYIGHSALLSQNSSGQKDSRSYLSTWFINSENPEGLWYSNNAQGVHMALMGDPTLVMQPVSRNTAFKNLTTAIQGDRAIISWDITDESLISGYFIYRAKEKNGPFTRLNSEALKMPQYIDSTSPNIVNFYTVRAVKLQSSPSGSYYTSIADASSDSVFIYPTSVAGEDINLKNITIVPNPARDYADISFKSSAFEKTDITIMDVAGREVLKLYSGIPEAGGISISWSLIDANRIRVPAGIYFIRIASGKNITMNKVVVIGG
ncbi:MAG TPA: T9SS type A sorting domain-containing protein, partial [Patescibacteria group bacterium]|nr:T9SS type A sorting domain-containing protein [Patescibacteria group bacterium]